MVSYYQRGGADSSDLAQAKYPLGWRRFSILHDGGLHDEGWNEDFGRRGSFLIRKEQGWAL